MGSVLQALYMTEDMKVKILRMLEDESTQSRNGLSTSRITEKKVFGRQNVLKETETLFYELLTSYDSSVSPSTFKACLPDQFSLSWSQHDALEFLQVYLDCLEHQLKSMPE